MRFILVLPLFFFACAQDMPHDVLPHDKMESVMWDVLRADEIAAYRLLKDSSDKRLSTHTALYDTVFAIHRINKDLFKKSLQYYQSRPDLLKTILDSLQKKTESPVALPVQ